MLACPSALQVAGPTIPSAVSPWLRWKALTARCVPGPKIPSTAIPSRRWSSRTRPRLLDAADAAGAARAPLCAARRSAAHVAGPTTPSAVRPWRRWKALTARLVPLPKMPSAWTPSQRWAFFTRAPLEPFLSGFAAAWAGAGASTAERADGPEGGQQQRKREVERQRSQKSVRSFVWRPSCAYEVS